MMSTARTATIRIAATIITTVTVKSMLTIPAYIMAMALYMTRTQPTIRTTIRVTNTKAAWTTAAATSPTQRTTMFRVTSLVTVTKQMAAMTTTLDPIRATCTATTPTTHITLCTVGLTPRPSPHGLALTSCSPTASRPQTTMDPVLTSLHHRLCPPTLPVSWMFHKIPAAWHLHLTPATSLTPELIIRL